MEERQEQMTDMNYEPSTNPNDENESRDGVTFNWFNLFLGVAIFLCLGSDMLSGDWGFYLYLSIVVVIHELGHVIAGKSFGCFIKEMQVFLLPFVSYKPRQDSGGSSWRDIKWSLGVLPLGGVTVFKSRKSDDKGDVDGIETGSWGMELKSANSPYIEDKPAWQRLLISGAGVAFNIITFLIIYFILPYISIECYDFFRPLAAMSLIIAVLNILPIYPLDGGAIVFALYEMVTGKKPSTGFTNACGWIGFLFIVLFFWVFPEWMNGILDSVFKLFF
jgi:membrane-associated protease RseP (regulator of RpoE activity)